MVNEEKVLKCSLPSKATYLLLLVIPLTQHILNNSAHYH